jgi:exosome complex exonuclease DIS3/RRP44
MLAAEYFPAGAHAPQDFAHYGLAAPIYTHFTSPIRRYADLVVHRQLAAAIGFEEGGPAVSDAKALERVCANINVRHRNAQNAGRASVEFYVGQALKGRVVTEEGFVMRVFENGFVVFVPRFGIEGLVRLRELATPEPKGAFDAEKYVLEVSGSRNAVIALFEQVKVRISDVLDESTGKRKIRLELVD